MNASLLELFIALFLALGWGKRRPLGACRAKDRCDPRSHKGRARRSMAIYSAQDQPNLTVLPVAYEVSGQPTDLLDPNKLRGSHQGIAL